MENWKPVVGYEGIYEVSNNGNVRRIVGWCNRTRRSGWNLAGEINTDGYRRVWLFRDGSRRRLWVHRIVAEAFIGPVVAPLNINHKNGLRNDNRAENLEIVTQSDNIKHSYLRGRQAPCGVAHWNARLTSADVAAIRSAALVPYRGVFSKLGRQYGVSAGAVANIVHGKSRRLG